MFVGPINGGLFSHVGFSHRVYIGEVIEKHNWSKTGENIPISLLSYNGSF